MLTEKDISYLQKSAGSQGQFVEKVLTVALVILVVVSMVNFQIASGIASEIGLSLADIFASWIEGYSPEMQYSGLTLLAIERFSTAIIELGFAIVMLVTLVVYKTTRKREKRIVAHLKELGKC